MTKELKNTTEKLKEDIKMIDSKAEKPEEKKEEKKDDVKADPTRFGDWEVNGRAIDF